MTLTDTLNTPTLQYQPAASEDQTINPVDDSAFDSLVQASKNLLEALEVWLAANCTQNQSQSQNQNQSPSNQDQAPEDSNALLTNISNHPRRDPATVKAFDDAWASYYNFFQAWKERDAQRLLSTLLDHARHINLLWRTVRNDPSARIEWEPRIEEQRKDLRVKASQLAGPEGAAQLDVVFADYMNGSAHTVTPSLAPPSQAGLDNIVIPAVSVSHENTSDSVHPRTQTTPSTAKKRQRASSVSKQKSAASATTSNVSKDLQTTYSGHSADMDSIIQPDATSATSSGYEAPKPKKPATTSAAAAAAAALETIPTGFEKPTKWTNLQLIHELAMDSGFKVEPNRPLGARTMHESPLLQTADQGGDDPTNAATGLQGLEDRIRAMATKAYFDQIRDDAAKGQLGKWIPSLLTTIREQLLDMVPPNSAIAMQITEGFDIEFVQQQIEKNVYDLTGALNGVVDIMSKLCAPVRDQAIKRIQESLNEISQDPSQLSAPDVTTETSATSIAPNDLVSVLQSILELLELMLLDMANFRLTVARPKLEKQAIPYEQSAFKESVDKGEVSLESTQNWLQDSAKRYLQQQASAPTLPVATEGGASSSANDDIPGPESSSNPGRRRHYDILVHSLLDLVFSSKRFDVGIDRVQFPATLALDRERMTRFQNEVQGLALVAVIMNISTNVSPMLSDESHEELKNTLLKLMEAPNTSLETLAEAVIEAKERELLMNARRSASKSSSPSSSAPGSSLSSTSSIIDSSSFPKLLLSDEQRNCIQNTVARAISFDSTLFRVLSQRLRKVLEDFTLSTPSSGGKSGAMPNEAALSKVGLGHLKKEIETLALQFRFLTKYNAQVYRPWYDPMLAKIISNIKKSGKQ
ncbi:hypothetical protein BX616_010689 [Lobosporangium transversale]|uniref:T-complex protein 11-domain-containing protein n=1 Tax=Lobosporangium transversale TaxID=64571 RepID=A0A1Y2G698_9FUNG|nr:T-complex protein 11-domain-containing protein [Lobosporangium transversale]KAF9917992.1 hypothetical protein BX616_010689 [Lobosporangium transversale]ORY97043.1 T-complex protein 11-domain-containing protein [Lobosporangium transversale]|eukprot:XP_021875589.1 T-complex protein 11-domain-containing protein [Lobosporangium transversale]